MIRSFGLDAPTALRALEITVEKLKVDILNEDLARDCAIKAWHLCDHVFIALGPESPFPTLADLKSQVRAGCPELGYLQDVCTDAKHGRISRYAPRTLEARHRVGDFSPDDFSSADFHTSRLEIELPGGRTVLFSDAVDRAVVFWTQFFDDHGIA